MLRARVCRLALPAPALPCPPLRYAHFRVAADDETRLDKWIRARYKISHATLDRFLRSRLISLAPPPPSPIPREWPQVSAGIKLDNGVRVLIDDDLLAKWVGKESPQQRVVTTDKLVDAVPVAGAKQSELDRDEDSPAIPSEGEIMEFNEDYRQKWVARIRRWVVYEDPDVVVLHKPAYFSVAPRSLSRPTDSRMAPLSLVEAALREIGANDLPQVVTRSDPLIADLIVVARNAATAKDLQASLKKQEFSFLYWALVSGTVGGRGVLRDAVDGKTAATRYNVLEQVAEHVALIALRPHTAVPGQLTAHLRSLGAPAIGDDQLSTPTEGAEAVQELDDESTHVRSEVGAHVCVRELLFAHPRTREAVHVKVPVPAVLRGTFRLFGLRTDKHSAPFSSLSVEEFTSHAKLFKVDEKRMRKMKGPSRHRTRARSWEAPGKIRRGYVERAEKLRSKKLK